MKKALLLPAFYCILLSLQAQDDTSFTADPMRRIKIYTLGNDTIKGILTKTTDTAIFVYSGNFRAYRQQKTNPMTVTSYRSVAKIETRQKTAARVFKGMGIGVGVALAPILVGSIFTPNLRGEGAGLAAAGAVPLGIIVGGVIGATSKKKFKIDSDIVKYQRFRRKVKI